MNIPETNLKRVVIVGCGFGGLSLAKALRNVNVQVVLLDRNNYHTFQPLLYQVASAGLEADSIAYPIRKIFKGQKNIFFRMAEVNTVNAEKQEIQTNIGTFSYDYLVIATGSQTGFFGLKNVQELSMTMKTVPQALNLRSLILQNFEKALLTENINDRKKLMNIVIAGGGPTGVELAGALAELKIHILPKDYPDLDIRQMQIHLVEAAPLLLGAMSQQSSEASFNYLEKLDVKIWLDTAVEDFDGNQVKLKGGKVIPSETLIWAAGVEGAPVKGIEGEALLPNKRLKVDEFNKVVSVENVFAIGDVASMNSEENPKGHPMLAQVAIQQGTLLAKNISNIIKNKPLKYFKYNDKGTMATIGRNKAVVELPFLKMHGFLSWFIWMFVHLMSLVGFRNRVVTLVNWMWSYFNYDKGVRLIIRPFKRSNS